MLRLSGGTLTALLLAGCGPSGSGGGEAGETTATSAQGEGQTTTGWHIEGTRGVVFNTASRDVTLFDPNANKVTGSHPINAVVRWLSNEQHYWDGKSVWTYDYPNNELQAIALNPQTFEVGKQVPVGKGPGHSFVLAPDNKRGYVNSAGADFVAVVDPVAGEIVERVQTGAYP